MSESKSRIVLFKSPHHDVWMARFEGPGADEIEAVFDTDTLPTPFTIEVLPETVQQELQNRNPSIEVVVATEGIPLCLS